MRLATQRTGVFLLFLLGGCGEDIAYSEGPTLANELERSCPLGPDDYQATAHIQPATHTLVDLFEGPVVDALNTSPTLTIAYASVALNPVVFSIEEADVPGYREQLQELYPNEEIPDPLVLTGCRKQGWVGEATSTIHYDGTDYVIAGDLFLVDGGGVISEGTQSLGLRLQDGVAYPSTLAISGELVWEEAL